MTTPFVEVVEPEQAPRYTELLGERNLVGTGQSCQVTVDRPEFAREHLLLSPQANGCFVAAARGVPTPIMFNGAPFERGLLPWGSSFMVGPVRFTLHDGSVKMDALAAKAAGGGKKEQANPVLIIGALLAIGVVGFMFMGGNSAEGLPQTTAAPPALFDPLERPCPDQDPAAAAQTARSSAREAAAKAERRPYRTQDGIQAVGLYAVAGACYRQVGDVPSAQLQMTAAQALSEEFERDYRNQLFRLNRAQELDRQEDMLIEARLLHNMIEHRPGAYLNWLITLERRLVISTDLSNVRGPTGLGH